MLTKQRTGVRALGRRGGLPRKLSRTPWANTLNAQVALIRRPYCSEGGKYIHLVVTGRFQRYSCVIRSVEEFFRKYIAGLHSLRLIKPH